MACNASDNINVHICVYQSGDKGFSQLVYGTGSYPGSGTESTDLTIYRPCIGNVLRSSRDSLIAVCALATGYILISALIVFNVEPDSFGNFFDAVYWATVSLTTVGYGDIYPVSDIGRVITMLSSVFGIAIVALPAGIITAGYMNEINKSVKNDKEE